MNENTPLKDVRIVVTIQDGCVLDVFDDVTGEELSHEVRDLDVGRECDRCGAYITEEEMVQVCPSGIGDYDVYCADCAKLELAQLLKKAKAVRAALKEE